MSTKAANETVWQSARDALLYYRQISNIIRTFMGD